jgi:NADH:ubiquinone reductase (H+-translocating)
MRRHPRVVIVGAGFGGLQCARKLQDKPVDVLVVDRNNYHLFTPLLYQVASSLLNPSDIARPVRSIFRRSRNVRFRQAEVVEVDFERKVVLTQKGAEVPYDTLVLGAGSATNYFGISGAEQRMLGLKDLPEALELRNSILNILEFATSMTGEDVRSWLTFVVAGGGPTGVEYAGALSELLRLVVPGEYPELTGQRLRIVLVEGLDEVLPPFPRPLGRAAHRELEQKGIEVRTGVRVASFDGERVMLSDGRVIPARTVVWAAGVKPSPLAEALGLPRSRSGRIEVDEHLRVRDERARGHIYAIGDIASFVQDGKEVPMLSAPAMQQGRLVAANILRTLRGEPPRPFRYRDRGTMATIGKNAAVAQVGRLRLDGFPGWVAWLVVHLYYLIGFRNRLAVLTSWAYNYLRSDRPVRIIARAGARSTTALRDEEAPAGRV